MWSVMSVVDRVRAVERSSESGQPILLKKVRLTLRAVYTKKIFRLMNQYLLHNFAYVSSFLDFGSFCNDEKVIIIMIPIYRQY